MDVLKIVNIGFGIACMMEAALIGVAFRVCVWEPKKYREKLRRKRGSTECDKEKYTVEGQKKEADKPQEHLPCMLDEHTMMIWNAGSGPLKEPLILQEMGKRY